jgi:Transcriptional regulator containing GAF, AAA-type ATPase, and DNA binding domains
MRHTTDSLYQSLLQINNILVREVTPEGLFRCLAEILKPMVNCDRISLTIYEPETDSLTWFAHAEGISVKRMDTGNVPVRGPLARRAIQSGQPVVALNLEEYAKDEAVQLMIDVGLRSALAFPLINRSKPIGAVVLSFMRNIDQEYEELCTIVERVNGQVALAVDNMLIHAKLNQQNKYLNQQVDSLLSADDGMHSGPRFFYSCETMQNLMNQMRLLAQSDAPVLICGETGTGKEFLSRFIHRLSKRSMHNFVKISCPALSPTLFESELFGHAKGAFTGATSRRLGRFELADKGSIFLDEIAELDIMLQAKLLHVLQDAKFERVGESHPINVDVRCISATNADLHHMMHEGKFRRDLYYRLGVTTVHIPALRDRKGELVPMLRYLMNIYSSDMQRIPPQFHPDALKMLEDYHWPGNVRELSNLLARLLILHSGSKIGVEHVRPLLERSSAMSSKQHHGSTQQPPSGFSTPSGNALPPLAPDNASALAQVEKAHIEHILTLTNGRISGNQGAAKLLNLPRSTLQYKLKKHGIKARKFMRA